MGFWSKFPTVGLSRSTWVDENDKFDGARTGNILFASTASIVTDAVAGVATHGLLKVTNHITGNAVARSPMLSTVLVGSGYGMSNGAASEIFHQQEQQGQFNPLTLDYGKIVQSALIQGAIDSVAAIPGGHQAEHEALVKYNQMHSGKEQVTKVPSFKKEKRADDLRSKIEGEDNAGPERCRMCINAEDARHTAIIPAQEVPTIDKYNRFKRQFSVIRPKEFYDTASNEVVQKPHKFVVYVPKDHKVAIRVPAEYDNLLKQVRNQRIRGEAGESPTDFSFDFKTLKADLAVIDNTFRTLPEDLIPHLDALPNSRLVKDMYLLNEKSPWDIKKPDKRFGDAAAEATELGEVFYFMTEKDPLVLRLLTNHEFGHLVHLKFKAAETAFESACKLENALNDPHLEFNANEYSTKNAYENFAVHFGEELLDPSPERFLQAVEYAPIRMAILAKALKSVLTEIPQAKVSLHHKQFMARAELLEKNLVPSVVEGIIKNIGKDSVLLESQLSVLSYLGKSKDIKTVLALADKVSDHKVGFALVEAGLSLCKGNRRQEVDFLLKVSEKTTNQFIREEAINKLTEEEIDTRLVSRIGDILNKPGLVGMRRLNDLSFWHEQEGQYELAERYARFALVLDCFNKSPNPEALLSMNLLGNNLMSQQKYKEAEHLMRESAHMSKKLYGEINSTTRDCLDRLGDFLFSQDRLLESIPFLVRRLQIDKALSKSADKQTITFDLQDLAQCYEELGLKKGHAHWQNELDKHLDNVLEIENAI